MTTERDVYEIDATGAQKSLEDVADAQEQVANKGKSLSDMFRKDLRDSLFSATAGYDALKTSIVAVVHFMKESVGAALEADKVDRQLEVALRNLGGHAEKWTQSISENATALERLTGVDDEYYKQLATLLTTFGVAPGEINRFTKAALDLAAATGQDAMVAAKLLARAHAEGKDELKKYGIEVDDAEFKLKGFGAVLEQVEQRFGGLHAQMPPAVLAVNELKGAWENFKESLGGTVLRVGEASRVTSFLTDALDGLSELLTHKVVDGQVDYAYATQVTTAKTEAYLAILAEGKEAQERYSRAVREGNPDVEKYGQELQRIKERLAAVAESQNAVGTGGLHLDPKALDNVVRVEPISLKGGKERVAELKKMEEEWKKHKEEMEKISLLSAANLQKMEDADEKVTRDRILAQGDWETAQQEEEKARLAGVYEFEHAQAEQAEQERQAAADAQYQMNRDAAAAEVAAVIAEQDKQLEMQRQLYAELGNIAKQGLDFVASLIQEQLTQNVAYNTAYHDALVQRRLYDQEQAIEEAKLAAAREDATEQDKEHLRQLTEAKMTAADVEKELAGEAKAAREKQTAAFLAGIAKEAGVKAVLESAEAIASLAKYDYGAAAQHGIAAAAFGTVALAAGGAAIALSANRGFTADEKASIESLNRRDTDRKERESKATTGGDVNTTQNVYFFGISGFSDIQQQAKLDELRRKYANLSTGSGP